MPQARIVEGSHFLLGMTHEEDGHLAGKIRYAASYVGKLLRLSAH
jgi:hypothetical protein